MDDKFLPLGTICNINNNNSLVMIIGYYSIKYNNKIIVYDYKGCIYPEGLLFDNYISFNHSDIVNVVFNGYADDNYKKLNNILLGQQGDVLTNNNSSVFKNLMFDDNGVVIYDPVEDEITDTEEFTKVNETISNPFYETYTEKQEETRTTSDSPIFKSIQFDENGVVISAEEN